MDAPRLLDHLGNPLPSDMDLFVPPPAEIGSIISACSTLRKQETPEAKWTQKLLIRAAIGGAIGAVIAIWAGALWVFPAGLIVGGLLGLRSRQTLTYVGTLGIALFEVRRSRNDVTRKLYFLFESARALRTSVTRRYLNAIYEGTSWSFVWSDEKGATVFQQSGQYYLIPKTAAHPYIFLRAAESAWSHYLIHTRLEDELRRTGAIRFDIKGSDWVSIGPGFAELCFGGQIARCDAEDIGAVSLREGVFTIKRKDAKIGWFSRTGVFSFEYRQMPNATVFYMLVGRLLGVPLT
jgi:hypothetical protein